MRGTTILMALGFLMVCVASVAWATPPKPARPRRGHGSITAQLDCSACHTPSGWSSLSPHTEGGFDHDRTGFPLRARHGRVACTQCHVAERELTRECVGCHEDVHRGRLSSDCSQCHGAASWHDTQAIELHRMTRLPLTGMHALADCTECHQRTTGRRFAPVPARCFACHADDYRRSDIHPLHTGSRDGSSPPFDRNCAACHRATGWSPAILPIGGLSEALALPGGTDHDLKFPIQFGVHRGADCGDCHARKDGHGPLRCTGCHAHRDNRLRTQHGDRMPARAGRACLGCHPGGATR